MTGEEYVEQADRHIKYLKENKRRIFADFTILLNTSSDIDYVKKYYEKKKMVIEMTKCGCGENKFDIIIELF